MTCYSHTKQGSAASRILAVVMKPQGGLLLLIFAFYAFTLRDGHRWGDDYAFYIHHAKNIATGLPYANTGYIADPYYPWYSPHMMPPVFPLLLAPVYKIFGITTVREMSFEFLPRF